ncbi:MAG: hypothetical protein ACYCZY_09810 [Lacisediminihabitans sp.]
MADPALLPRIREFMPDVSAYRAASVALAEELESPLRPDQLNHAWAVVETKLRRSRFGQIDGYGLKIYP